jgi:hypothetical protein
VNNGAPRIPGLPPGMQPQIREVQRLNPLAVFCGHTGLSPMQLQALGAKEVPCLCGCDGTRLQLGLALHARRGVPEFIDRDMLTKEVQMPAAPREPSEPVQ